MIGIIDVIILPLLILAAYLPAYFLPPVSKNAPFPSRREWGAVLLMLIILPLLIHITPAGVGALFILLLWAWWLPAWGVGIAGRRPFLYGFLIGIAYTIVLILMSVSSIYRTAPEDRHVIWESMSIWISISITASLLSVTPIALYWRARFKSES